MAIKITTRSSVAAYAGKVAALTDLSPKIQINRPGRPASGKVRVTMLLRPETIARFKATGKGWQARMSDALDAYSSGL